MEPKSLKPSSKADGALVKKILFLETNSDYYSFFKNMYLALERLCDKMLHFNRREIYFKYGKDKMNSMLLELIEKEKPDYVFTWLTWDEFYIDTLLKINSVSPNTKMVAIFGDDSIQFEDFSRFYARLFNYSFTTLKAYQEKYRKEGVRNIYVTSLTDAKSFFPIQGEKKYDVTFIGSQKMDKSGRYEFVKHLKENGVDVKVFGFGWEHLEDLKDIYGGPLESKDVVKVLNESKINLCFSKDNFGNPQMKAKIFEVGACKAFTLCEYAKDYDDYFKKGKEIVFFRDKSELLDKVKYYLEHEKEREKIAKQAYDRVVKEYSLHNELRNFILKTRKNKPSIELPPLKKSVKCLSKEDFELGREKLFSSIEDIDYVSFKTDGAEHLDKKDYFQTYGLIKTGKEISCCNYYVHSNSLGDYLLFFTRDGLALLDKKDFDSVIDINQLVVKKKYFVDNYDKLKRCFFGETIDFLNKDSTVFVAIPLLRIRKVKTHKYDVLQKAFGFKFLYRAYSAVYQKKFFDPFLFFVLLEGLLSKRFILRAIFDTLKDKNLLAKINKQ